MANVVGKLENQSERVCGWKRKVQRTFYEQTCFLEIKGQSTLAEGLNNHVIEEAWHQTSNGNSIVKCCQVHSSCVFLVHCSSRS